jgi:Flp pilus assembly protein TadG
MKIKSMKYSLSEKGQALVEFAIILPLLFLLVFGITEFGRFLYLKNSVTNAVRAGVRCAVVNSNWGSVPLDGSNVTLVNYIKNAIPAAIRDVSTIKTYVNGTEQTTAPTTSGATIKVSITAPFVPVIGSLPTDVSGTTHFFFTTIPSISASATMRYE